MAAAGAVGVERSHGYCRDRRQPRFAADGLLGISGWLTPLLDVYHGCGQLAKLGRAALGEERVGEWLGGARVKRIADGYRGVCEVIAGPGADGEVCRRVGGRRGRCRTTSAAMQGLGYAARLRRVQAIGSGLVEGTIEQRANVRMKRSGARWLPGHAGPFVELLALADTPEWAEFWASMAA